MKNLLFLKHKLTTTKTKRFQTERSKKLSDKSLGFTVNLTMISVLLSSFFLTEQNIELALISLFPLIIVILHTILLRKNKLKYTYFTSTALVAIFLLLQSCVINNFLVRSPNMFRYGLGYLIGFGITITMKNFVLITLGLIEIGVAFLLSLFLYFYLEYPALGDNLMMLVLHIMIGLSIAYNSSIRYKNFIKRERQSSESMQKNIYHLIAEYFDSNATIIVSSRKNGANMDSSIRPVNRLFTEEGGLLGHNNHVISSNEVDYVLSYQSQSAYSNFRLQSYEDLSTFFKDLKVISSNECKWATDNFSGSYNISNGYVNRPSMQNQNQNQKKTVSPVALKDLIGYLMENNINLIVPEQFSERSTGIFIDEPILISDSRYEFACISKTKKKYYVKIFALSHHKNLRVVISVTDISSHVLNTRLMALDKHKDQILAMVTHDLRNPLSVIKNNLDFIQSEINLLMPSAGLISFLKNSFINCKLLETLISDILDYGQIKNGKMKMIMESFKAKDILDELWFMFSSQFYSKNRISFTILYDNRLPAIIVNDRERLKQVIINLLSNALKFTSHGHVTLTFSMKSLKFKDSASKDYMRISVSDTGSGIASNILPLLFKPYSTFGNEEEHNVKGIGLGLLICKKLVSRLGPINKIFVKSREKHGSTFWFYICLKNEEPVSCGNLVKIRRDSSIESLEDRNAMLKMFGIQGGFVAEEAQEILLESIKFDEEGLAEYDEVDEEHAGEGRELGSGNSIVISRGSKEGKSSFFIYNNLSTDSLNHIPDTAELENNIQKENNIITRNSKMDHKRKTIGPIFSYNSNKDVTNPGDTPSSPQVSSCQIPGKLIILVDDEEFNHQIYIHQLRSLAVQITKYFNGRDALENIKQISDSQKKPSLILMDFNMPVMDGIETTKEIRKIEGMESIPIIGITGYNDIHILDEAKNSGMTEILQRPYSQQRLLEIVSSILG